MGNEVRRVCPFCGKEIVLNWCSIYATAGQRARRAAPVPEPVDALLSDVLDEPSDDELIGEVPPAPRTARPARSSSGLLWSWTPPAPPEPVRRGRWFSPTPARPVEQGLVSLTAFAPGLLPRRYCYLEDCGQPLPPDLDDRQARIVSVVGLNAAGKTYYLATALTEALNGPGLDIAGFREFEPDEETAQRFFLNYYSPVYRDNQALQATPEAGSAGQKSLNFRARIDGGHPMLVMTHDISGETLMDYAKRARDAGFLRHSSAVIFLVDPLEFEPIREQSYEHIQGRTIHQRDLLAATLRELESEVGGHKVPVAVVVSKSDLLEPFLPASATLLGPPPRHREQTLNEWLRELHQTSAAVREVLIKMGQDRLVRAAESYGPVSFHAVSALGGRPAPGGPSRPNPRRVLDPLALVLWRLSNALT